jgi:hypothetical protein
MKTIAAVMLALLAGASAPKPKVELKPLQRITNLAPGRCEAVVVFKLRVEDAGAEDYYCPRVVWEWEDGAQSMEESDCVPFDQAPKEDHVRTWTKSHSFHASGTHRVRVTLCRASRKVRVVDASATITGWEGCPEYQGRRGGGADISGSDEQEDLTAGLTRESSRDPCAERKN